MTGLWGIKKEEKLKKTPWFRAATTWVEEAWLGVPVECNEELHPGPAEHRKAGELCRQPQVGKGGSLPHPPCPSWTRHLCAYVCAGGAMNMAVAPVYIMLQSRLALFNSLIWS